MTIRSGRILVVGGGVGGMEASLELAEAGHEVILVERAPHLGGLVSQLDRQFPSNRCGMCRMLPMLNRDFGVQSCLRRALHHDRIHIRLLTDVTAVAGEAGKFDVSLRKTVSGVDPVRCIGCGACAAVCPVEVPDAFNTGLSVRKAVFQAAPFSALNSWRIDPAVCTRCGACVPACPTGAIQLADAGRKAFRILVVDDEQIVRDSTAEWLIEEGFTVERAGSGSEALDLISRLKPHLMLLDIKMPGMDGIETLKKAMEAAPDTVVVMMTAYATVETAVEAMKSGAAEYLIKPFEPDALLTMTEKRYGVFVAAMDERVRVGAIVLAGGVALYDPASDVRNTLGYRVLPQVVTSLEFERMLSSAGPFGGLPLRPDGTPLSRIAWIQCVGSRDLQLCADYCSGVCCMISIKEALLAREALGSDLTTDIFYMDMRTFGKSFQRYRDRATSDGVRFIRARVHSAFPDPASGGVKVRYIGLSGADAEDRYDCLVLAVGQRPHPDMALLAERYGICLTPEGFAAAQPFSASESSRAGIFMAGSFSGLTDIRESVVQASAAALNASLALHALTPPHPQNSDAAAEKAPFPDVSREPSRVLAAVCSCDAALEFCMDAAALTKRLKQDPAVEDVIFFNHMCSGPDREALVQEIRQRRPNRLLAAACAHCADVFQEAAASAGIPAPLCVAMDIRTPVLNARLSQTVTDAMAGRRCADVMTRAVMEGLIRVKHAEAGQSSGTTVIGRALVVGAGVAGMTAALAIADHGYPVDLVERGDHPGGNLHWIHRTWNGDDVALFSEAIIRKVEAHPQIRMHTRTRIVSVWGEAGRFYTTAAGPDGAAIQLEHGALILATGGGEAPTQLYGHGENPAVMTQKEFEIALNAPGFASRELSSVVMIQCVGSREAPRNFCSRVCCQTAVKQALALKERYPDVQVYVLYRDMMLYGFSESAYTRARREGVVFIPCTPDRKPVVETAEDGARVVVFDPVSDKRLAIETDVVILATGVVPDFSSETAEVFGAGRDEDGFFMEADAKWRPVDAMKAGVFGCGMMNAPMTIREAAASAEAAAMRALRILSRKTLDSSRITAIVRHSLCSRCQLCVAACPYGARAFDAEADQIRVNAVMCQGCGACASICPNGAAVVEGFTVPQVFEMIDAAVI